jgi:hypothetical protein
MTTLPFEFENDFPIYIRLNYKNLIFKLSPEEYKTYNNQLSCIYPKEAKAVEDRGLGRTKLPKKNSLNVTLRTFAEGTVLDIKVNLEDISDNGLGVRASIINKAHFHKDAVFKIIKVCGTKLMEEATLSVRHISEKEHKSFIGVGLLGSVPFSDQLFAILRDEMKKERFAS